MALKNFQNIYFLGIGGIGMSALARYFKTLGKFVAGYDLTSTDLTTELSQQAIDIHFDDNVKNIPTKILEHKNDTLIVITPAIPKDNLELNYFISNNFQIIKRAQLLGLISKDFPTVAIAGTHGKTSVTTLTSHILLDADAMSCAFMGGISKNYNTNLLFNSNFNNNTIMLSSLHKHKYIVIEADEFDRSFLNLYPEIGLITSVDADHLDIYGDKSQVEDAFSEFANQINPTGKLIINSKVKLKNLPTNVKTYSYSLEEKSDFYASKITLIGGFYHVDINCLNEVIENVRIGVPGLVNTENAIAATAIAYLSGVNKVPIKKSLESFLGVKRRFDIKLNNEKIYIDDYAHHPEELKAFISSVKKMFPDKKITGIFQPHLFSRTNDFAFEFAKSLELLDQLILLEIYPAREKPMEGVSSEIIFNQVNNLNKKLIKKTEIIETLKNIEIEVLLTMGAGDIDKEVENILKFLIK